MNFRSLFGAFFQAVLPNTHAVGMGGFATVLAALAIHTISASVNPTGDGHGLAQIALHTIDQYAAMPAITGGALASLLGRDPRVPADPKQ